MQTTAYPYGYTPPIPAPSGLAPWARLLERAGRLILAIVAAHAESRRTRGTAQELARLSDRELHDIGLTRADVDLMDLSIR